MDSKGIPQNWLWRGELREVLEGELRSAECNCQRFSVIAKNPMKYLAITKLLERLHFLTFQEPKFLNAELSGEHENIVGQSTPNPKAKFRFSRGK